MSYIRRHQTSADNASKNRNSFRAETSLTQGEVSKNSVRKLGSKMKYWLSSNVEEIRTANNEFKKTIILTPKKDTLSENGWLRSTDGKWRRLQSLKRQNKDSETKSKSTINLSEFDKSSEDTEAITQYKSVQDLVNELEQRISKNHQQNSRIGNHFTNKFNNTKKQTKKRFSNSEISFKKQIKEEIETPIIPVARENDDFLRKIRPNFKVPINKVSNNSETWSISDHSDSFIQEILPDPPSNRQNEEDEILFFKKLNEIYLDYEINRIGYSLTYNEIQEKDRSYTSDKHQFNGFNEFATKEFLDEEEFKDLTDEEFYLNSQELSDDSVPQDYNAEDTNEIENFDQLFNSE